MTARLLDGKSLAAKLGEELRVRTSDLVSRSGAAPRLAIIRFGDAGPSDVYVRSLARAAERVGIEPVIVRLPPDAKRDAVHRRISELNADASVAASACNDSCTLMNDTGVFPVTQPSPMK